MPQSSKFSDLSDEALLDLIGKEKEAESEFYRRYKVKVRWLIRKYRLNPAEREDLIQEGMIGLFSAIATYDKEKAAKFSTYAGVCMRNRISNALSAQWSQSKNLDDRHDVESIVTEHTPESSALLSEAGERIRSVLLSLSELERELLSLYLDKKSYQEIADELDISPKKVDNTLMKIKGRLAREFEGQTPDFQGEAWEIRLKNSIQKGLNHE